MDPNKWDHHRNQLGFKAGKPTFDCVCTFNDCSNIKEKHDIVVL
jgi:hypothetical protein